MIVVTVPPAQPSTERTGRVQKPTNYQKRKSTREPLDESPNTYRRPVLVFGKNQNLQPGVNGKEIDKGGY
jgi:hypothetical protein